MPARRSPVIPGHQIVGRVQLIGRRVDEITPGQRVGVAWLHRTCTTCRFCQSRRENLCERGQFTGWTVDGGYAEYVVAPAQFTYPLSEGFSDLQAAPLLCAGIIGYRALRLTGLPTRDPLRPEHPFWSGVAPRAIRFRCSGTRRNSIGSCAWRGCLRCHSRPRTPSGPRRGTRRHVGEAFDDPPVKLDAAIFAPAGELVPAALKALDKGGTLVLGGIHMSPIPAFEYALLYGERVVRSVANNTRLDGEEFLSEAARIPVRTHTQQFPLERANGALIALKHDAIRGAGVLVIS